MLVMTGMLVTLSVATSRVPYVMSLLLSSRSANRWRNRAYRPSWGKSQNQLRRKELEDVENLPPLTVPKLIVESTAKDSSAKSAATILCAHSLE